MRITRIFAPGFGPFSQWRADDLDAGLIVFTGDNEAGKSSLFRLVGSVLYGIRPTSLDKHDSAPWSGAPIEIGLELRLADDTRVNLSRRLVGSGPTGELIRGSDRKSLANRVAPMAAHVPRELFEELFLIDLDRLRFPGDNWESLQDLLIGGLGAGFLRPVRTVLAELEQEGKRLWSADGRVRSALDRQLEQEIAELYEQRQEAERNDELLRRLIAERDELARTKDNLSKRRTDIRVRLSRIDRLTPVRDGLYRIERLREQAGDLDEIADLPDDPAGELDRLRGRIAELKGNLEKGHRQRGQWEEELRELDERFAPAAGCREEIEQLLERAEVWCEGERRKAALAGDIGAARANVVQAGTEVLDSDDPERIAGLRKVGLIDLKKRVGEWRQAHDELKQARARHDPATAGRGGRLPWLAIGLGLAGLSFTVAGGLIGETPVWLSGLVMLAAAGLVWYQDRSRGRRETADLAVRGDQVRQLERDERQGQARVSELLAGLPVAAVYLERPDDDLPTAVRRATDAVSAWQELLGERERLESSLEGAHRELQDLAGDLDLDPADDIATYRRRLQSLVRDLDQAEVQRQTLVERLAELADTRRELDRDLSQLRSGERELVARLAEVGNGDPDRGAEAVAGRRRAAATAAERERDLLDDYPRLDRIRREIDEYREDLDLSDVDRERLDQEILGLEEELEQISRRTGEVETEAERLRDAVTPDLIAGRIERLREQQAEARRRRDRLAVLAELIALADRRFRDEHQPDVLQRAGRYLAAITGGRYDRLIIDETASPPELYLPAGTGVARLDGPISRGTREQVYLALRLAIVDHIDSGDDPLPLVLDEVFVNWDEGRRRRAVELLTSIAASRQIVLFTCHRWLQRELAAAGAAVRELPPVPASQHGPGAHA